MARCCALYSRFLPDSYLTGKGSGNLLSSPRGCSAIETHVLAHAGRIAGVSRASIESSGVSFSDADERRFGRIVWSIAAGAFLASFAMNFWWPILPLYLQEIGATSKANALFWVALATAVQGIGRLLTGPIWGGLSDRYGRKLMFVRALYAGTATTIVAAIAHAPWVIVVSLGMQGVFSGFIPAAIALTSVSVPDARLNKSLGVVTAGQYLGSTLGPMCGGLLAIYFGYRGAIVVSAMLPAAAAIWIMFAVPRDVTAPRVARAVVKASSRRFRLSVDMARGFSRTFWVMVVLYFGLFALNQMVRVSTPIALQDMLGDDKAKTISSLAFTLAGFASVVGVTLIARMLAVKASLRQSLVLLTLVSALVVPVLALNMGAWVFLGGFFAFALLNGASMPATNTLIASTVPAARRGTAFGLASSAQALAFIVGPLSAAWFVSVSLPLMFIACSGGFVLLTLMLLPGIRAQRVASGAAVGEPVRT